MKKHIKLQTFTLCLGIGFSGVVSAMESSSAMEERLYQNVDKDKLISETARCIAETKNEIANIDVTDKMISDGQALEATATQQTKKNWTIEISRAELFLPKLILIENKNHGIGVFPKTHGDVLWTSLNRTHNTPASNSPA